REARRAALFMQAGIFIEAAGRGGRALGRDIAQLVGPVLARKAAQLGVKINRAALDLLELGSVLHPLVDAGHDEAHGVDVADALAVEDVVEGIDIAIDAHADAVARVRRAEDRQDEIGPAILDAPAVERLAEIADLRLQ